MHRLGKRALFINPSKIRKCITSSVRWNASITEKCGVKNIIYLYIFKLQKKKKNKVSNHKN